MNSGGAPRRVRVIVRGRVQGVAFRAATAEAARRAGACGWVRNRPDGPVEAPSEGAHVSIDAMLAFVRRGPRAARVTDVEVLEERPGGDRSFEIWY
jgi:acylphosphatase